MGEFISEPITPLKGAFDTQAMARGEPGLPRGFVWHGERHEIVERLEQWKQSAPEGGRPGNEVYLRRHCYRLRMASGQVWTVYFTRQPARGSRSRQRWFVYTIDEGRQSGGTPKLPLPD